MRHPAENNPLFPQLMIDNSGYNVVHSIKLLLFEIYGRETYIFKLVNIELFEGRGVLSIYALTVKTNWDCFLLDFSRLLFHNDVVYNF